MRRGYDDPIETYSSNVMGTVNLFEAIRQLARPCVIVNVTSDKCYDNREWMWGYRETEPMGGHDPYSNSKACAELVTSKDPAALDRAIAAIETQPAHRAKLAETLLRVGRTTFSPAAAWQRFREVVACPHRVAA